MGKTMCGFQKCFFSPPCPPPPSPWELFEVLLDVLKGCSTAKFPRRLSEYLFACFSLLWNPGLPCHSLILTCKVGGVGLFWQLWKRVWGWLLPGELESGAQPAWILWIHPLLVWPSRTVDLCKITWCQQDSLGESGSWWGRCPWSFPSFC